MQDLDPVTVAVALFSVTFGPAIAKVAGPYAVILIAASTGASWALARRDPTGLVSATWFFTRVNFMAVLLTVAVTQIVYAFGTPFESRWLLAPVALFIGGIGDDWPHVGAWLLSRVGKFIDGLINIYTSIRTKPEASAGDDQ